MSTDAQHDSTTSGLQVHLTFWQHPLVQDLLPLGTSIIFHLALIVIGLITWGTYKAVTSSVLHEQIIIPEAALIDGADIGGIPNPGLGGDPSLSAAQNVDPNATDSDGWSDKHSSSLNTTLMQGGGEETGDSVIAQGPLLGLAGAGSGTGDGAGGGPMARYGVPGGGQGLGPPSRFMGISGNAKRIVYICDASGSMIGAIPRVKTELNKAIEALAPIQAFNIIVFTDANVNVLDSTGLVMATPANKHKAFDMSKEIFAYGNTESVFPALRKAFEQKPELIYMLTDGFDQAASYESIVNLFHTLNSDKKVKVNTILIKSREDPDLERVVRIIASENGGQCKIVDSQDL